MLQPCITIGVGVALSVGKTVHTRTMVACAMFWKAHQQFMIMFRKLRAHQQFHQQFLMFRKLKLAAMFLKLAGIWKHRKFLKIMEKLTGAKNVNTKLEEKGR